MISPGFLAMADIDLRKTALFLEKNHEGMGGPCRQRPALCLSWAARCVRLLHPPEVYHMLMQRLTAAPQGPRNGRTGARCALPLCWADVGDFERALPLWQILTQHYYGNRPLAILSSGGFRCPAENYTRGAPSMGMNKGSEHPTQTPRKRT